MRKTVQQLEDIFSSICRDSYPYEWEENHLSFQLMSELRKLFSNREIRFNNWSKIVDWQSFKNRGKQETNFGDIALIVNVQFSSGEVLRGVANIEAKRDFDSKNFESMDIAQLQRIYANAPHSQLLLYTHQQNEWPKKFPDDENWRSHLWVSPINTAKQLLAQLNKETRWVLRTAFPFSMFLTSRVFWGLDLDFREEVLNDIEAGINKIIAPSFLGVVNVYYDHQQPIRIDLSDIWEEI